MFQGGTPVLVLNTNTKRDMGRKAQFANIQAVKAIADIVTTTLGPQSMLKMLMDPMGGIVITNDGQPTLISNAILREIDVQHPAAKSMIELSRAQDQEVGDGTTSVIILASQMMQTAKPFLQANTHPTMIVSAYYKAMQVALSTIDQIAKTIDLNNNEQIFIALQNCIGTKFSSRWGNLLSDLTLKAVRIIARGSAPNKLGLQVKRYAKVEKIPGGILEQSRVIQGVMINKDVTHPQMRRSIDNPRVILLDCPLQYKKGQSQTTLQMTKESDMPDALQQQIKELAIMCNYILMLKPDVVITEKGVSDLAQHFLIKQNVSVIRRVRKTDNVRIARVTGAKIVSRAQQLNDTDVGTACGDQYYTYFLNCKNATACSILLRGGSKDILNQMQRNLHDCLSAAKNIFLQPKLIPGGGATEMAIANNINKTAAQIDGQMQMIYKAVGYAFQIIPKILAQNCGMDVIRTITDMRAQHSNKGKETIGIDGNKKMIVDMKERNIWEPISVKQHIIKLAIESSCMLLRIDDVLSGIKKKQRENKSHMGPKDDGETFGDERDG